MTAEFPLVQFGTFTFDARTESLWQGSVLLPSRPKDAAVLRVLLDHVGQIVSQEALLEAVWPKTFVTDTVLKNCINRLRRLLGDTSKAPRYIETWRRRGYRFIAPITTTPERETEPIEAFPQTLAPSSTLRSLKPLVLSPVLLLGREEEWQQLLDGLGHVLAGERRVFFISGEPGIGKTALVTAFAAHVVARGSIWVGHGQCLEHYGVGEPYHPVLEALDRLCRGSGGERLVEILRQEAPTWLTQLPGVINVTEAEILQRLLLQTTQARMLRELAVALERLTVEVPLVLVLEDLQWSDYGTVDLLTMLAHRQDPARLLVLATHRPAEGQVHEQSIHWVVQELRFHRQCQELTLQVLPEPVIARYLAARVPWEDPSPMQTRWLHRWTGGQPLFLVLMVEELMQRGWLNEGVRPEDLERMINTLPRRIPERLWQAIERRLARLTFAEQQVLEVASVVGAEFSAAAVAAGLVDEVIPIEAQCEALAGRGDFLEPRGTAAWPDGTVAAQYGFRHALYQRVVAERIPAARRQHLHQRIGLRLEQAYGERVSEIAASLAMHWQEGREPEQALCYRQQAAEKALRHHAYREAIDHLTTAFTLLQTLQETPERAQRELALQLMLGEVVSIIKGYAAPEVEQALTRARELCQQAGDTFHLFRVLWGLRMIAIRRGDIETALELANQVYRLSQRAHDPGLVMAAQQGLAAVLFWRGELAQARDHGEGRLAIYDAQRERLHPLLHRYDLGVTCLEGLAWSLWFLGYPDQGLQRSQEAQTLARELGSPFIVAHAVIAAAALHQFRREAQLAQERAETAMAIAKDHEFPYFAVWGTILRGWALAQQGCGTEGVAQLRQGLMAYHALGTGLGRPYFLALLAEACGHAGQAIEGLPLLDEALAVAHRTGERVYEAELYRLKAELLLQVAGKGGASFVSAVTEATGCLRQALNIAARQHAKALELRAAMSLSRLWQQQGIRVDARRLLAPIYGWFTEGLDTADLQEARSLLQELGAAHAEHNHEVRSSPP